MATIKSIEEKAKRYDEAIEKIQKYVKDDYGCTRLRPEDIFPELKESDDERVRKELVQFFKEKDEEDFEEWIPKAKVLSWLEKQGEQKPAWSEEDETNLRRTEYAVMKFFGGDCSLVGWLRKSLKERYTWKPSDEQMERLYDVVYEARYKNDMSENGYSAYKPLNSLYLDLKKLKG